jgi:hypothetical protein
MEEDVAAKIGSHLSLILFILLSNYYFSLIILSFELFISLICIPTKLPHTEGCGS